MARPNNYKKLIEPYLDKISEMALTMSEEQIAETLGVGYSTFKRYKKDNEPLRASLKSGRKALVIELKSNLIKKAKGFEYTETKEIKEKNPVTGKLEVVRVETTKKFAPPDVAANNLLLKNYDKENWANDPQMVELRKKELELKEKSIEANEW